MGANYPEDPGETPHAPLPRPLLQPLLSSFCPCRKDHPAAVDLVPLGGPTRRGAGDGWMALLGNGEGNKGEKVGLCIVRGHHARTYPVSACNPRRAARLLIPQRTRANPKSGWHHFLRLPANFSGLGDARRAEQSGSKRLKKLIVLGSIEHPCHGGRGTGTRGGVRQACSSGPAHGHCASKGWKRCFCGDRSQRKPRPSGADSKGGIDNDNASRADQANE